MLPPASWRGIGWTRRAGSPSVSAEPFSFFSCSSEHSSSWRGDVRSAGSTPASAMPGTDNGRLPGRTADTGSRARRRRGALQGAIGLSRLEVPRGAVVGSSTWGRWTRRFEPGAGRLCGRCGLTVFWLLLAYPIVITVGWGDWASFVVLGWAAMGFVYFSSAAGYALRQRIGARSQQP